jgi:hypothetical protein
MSTHAELTGAEPAGTAARAAGGPPRAQGGAGESVSALKPARGRWTADDLRRLPVTTDLATAGSVLDMGLTKARELARSGRFPVRVIKHGDRYVVPVAGLMALLGVAPDAEPQASA